MTLPPAEDPVRRAEYNPDNVARVRDDVRTTLRQNGCILPDYVVDALVEQILDEALATRRRVGYMVHVFNESFGDECTPERLERLEMCILLHERAEGNSVKMPV